MHFFNAAGIWTGMGSISGLCHKDQTGVLDLYPEAKLEEPVCPQVIGGPVTRVREQLPRSSEAFVNNVGG